MKAASKLTGDDIATYNLIYFGAPGANSIAGRLAGKLPAQVVRGAHTGDEGVICIHPNPENPERYFVLWIIQDQWQI